VDPEHGSWYFAVQIQDGQPGPTRIRRDGYRTARKASAARDQLLATVATGGSARRVTVEQWLLRWLEALPRRVRRSTTAGCIFGSANDQGAYVHINSSAIQ
jgi:hypothetical protein